MEQHFFGFGGAIQTTKCSIFYASGCQCYSFLTHTYYHSFARRSALDGNIECPIDSSSVILRSSLIRLSALELLPSIIHAAGKSHAWDVTSQRGATPIQVKWIKLDLSNPSTEKTAGLSARYQV